MAKNKNISDIENNNHENKTKLPANNTLPLEETSSASKSNYSLTSNEDNLQQLNNTPQKENNEKTINNNAKFEDDKIINNTQDKTRENSSYDNSNKNNKDINIEEPDKELNDKSEIEKQNNTSEKEIVGTTNNEEAKKIQGNKNNKIIKNYAYNMIYQVILIIVPLIITPYISRVLLPDGVGNYSFSASLITYFTIFAALGFKLYGQREIAKYQNDKYQQSKVIYEISIIRIFTVSLCLLLNLLLCWVGVYGEYKTNMLILSINIIAILFDFSFCLEGNEEFKKLAIRNILIKALSVASIFLFVKGENDVWIYTLINAASTLISNLVLLIYLPKQLCKVPFKELKPLKRIVPVLKLFLPTIVTSIYTLLDKTLIGVILQSDAQNGFYHQADRIIRLVIVLTTSLSSVMVSRNSNEKQKNNKEALKNNLCFASKIVMFIGFPSMFGTIAIANNMNLWFFGSGYSEVIPLMIILAPLILIIGLNNITGVQYLIAVGRENTLTITVLIGAIVNLGLNIAFLYLIGTIGVAIASLIAETLILIIQMVILRKEIPIKKMIFCGWKNLVSSVLMFCILWVIQSYMVSSILNTVLLIVIGVLIYIISSILLRDEFLLYLFNNFKNKFIKKKK